MPINPKVVLQDLEEYISLYNIGLSKDAKNALEEIEVFSYKCNFPSRLPLFFSKSIRNSKAMQKYLHTRGINSNLAALQMELRYYGLLNASTDYQRGTMLYSCIHDRKANENTCIIDNALLICTKSERAIINSEDILTASMKFFEERADKSIYLYQGAQPKDSNYAFFHIYGCYDDNLNITFDEIKDFVKNLNSTSNNFIMGRHIFK